MAVCDLCKGTGRLLKPWYDTTGLMTGFTGDICFKCDGKGTIGEPMTNEEWRKTCSAEEFAEALTKVVLNIVSWNNDPKPSEVRNILKTWLKQPHTTEVEK